MSTNCNKKGIENEYCVHLIFLFEYSTCVFCNKCITSESRVTSDVDTNVLLWLLSVAISELFVGCNNRVPSVLWSCWLGSRKGIRPVKSWVVRYWCGYLSGARCMWSSWSHCHLIISCSSKIQTGLPFWCRLIQVVLEKRLLNVCSIVV